MNKCIQCGKYGNFETLCARCYLKDNPILHGFKPITINLCIMCNKFSKKNKWIKYSDIEKPIKQTILDKIKISPGFKLKKIKIEPLLPDYKPGPGLKLDAESKITITAIVKGFDKPLSEQYILPIKLNFSYCTKCSKAGTQYFEAILQIRNPHKDAIDFINEKVKTNPSQFSSKTQETKSGNDYYLTNTSFARSLAKELHNKFGGELKISSKLHTKDKMTSRQVYRVSALLRLPDFKPGDIIETDKNPVLITKIGKKILGKDLLTKKQTTIDTSANPKILEIKKTTVLKTRPSLEVLHPETYQSTKIETPKKLKPGQKVKIIISKKRLFLVD